jgi:hypothetical protein
VLCRGCRQAGVVAGGRGVSRLPASTALRLEALVSGSGVAGDEADSVLALVKSDPGNVSLESMLTEIKKLRAVRRDRATAGPVRRCGPEGAGRVAFPGFVGVPIASA